MEGVPVGYHRALSPGTWSPPAGAKPAWNWLPPEAGAHPRLDLVPRWVRWWYRTPFVDRYAHVWMWHHGGWELATPIWLPEAFAAAMAAAGWTWRPVEEDGAAISEPDALAKVRDVGLATAAEMERAEAALIDLAGGVPAGRRGLAWVVFVPDVLGYASGPAPGSGEQSRVPKPAYGPLLLVLDAASGDFRTSLHEGTEGPDPVSGPA